MRKIHDERIGILQYVTRHVYDGVELHENGKKGEKVELGINWSAWGTVGTGAAIRMLETIRKAVIVAEAFNSLLIDEVIYDGDPEINNREAYEEACEHLRKWVESEKVGFIRSWLANGIVEEELDEAADI